MTHYLRPFTRDDIFPFIQRDEMSITAECNSDLAITDMSFVKPTDEQWTAIDLAMYFRRIPSPPGTTAYINVSHN